MFFSHWVFGFLAFNLCHYVNAQGGFYYIDPESCKGEVGELVGKAMEGALAMANAGLSRVQGQLEESQSKLLIQLFGNNDASIARVNQVFGGKFGITTMSRTEDPGLLKGTSGVKVYCDISRLKIRLRSKDHLFDKDSKSAVPLSRKIDCVRNLAYATLATGKFWQLQICPWYLAYELSLPKDVRITTEIPKGLWTKIINKLAPFVANKIYSPIDMVNSLDRVLLHELTHTTFGSMGSNAQDPGTYDVGGLGGYGWKNCRKLSTVVTSFPDDTYGGDQNADTWALYGSASFLLSGGKDGQPKYVEDDGKIYALTQAAARMIKRAKGIWKKFVA